MKNYCVDLEIAKLLTENNFPQNTFLRYQIDTLGEVELETTEFAVHDHVIEVYPAPTSDELLKELPKVKDYGVGSLLWLTITHNTRSFVVTYSASDGNQVDNIASDEKLANALAKIYLELKKENWV